jgi:hypothetical protein
MSGNLLIGIVRPDGTVASLRHPLEVDERFVERATAGGQRPPEARFRFAGACVTSACRHWTGERCGVGDAVSRAAVNEQSVLAPCAIRPMCRWWHQGGPAACSVCPHIVHTTTVGAASPGR